MMSSCCCTAAFIYTLCTLCSLFHVHSLAHSLFQFVCSLLIDSHANTVCMHMQKHTKREQLTCVISTQFRVLLQNPEAGMHGLQIFIANLSQCFSMNGN